MNELNEENELIHIKIDQRLKHDGTEGTGSSRPKKTLNLVKQHELKVLPILIYVNCIEIIDELKSMITKYLSTVLMKCVKTLFCNIC